MLVLDYLKQAFGLTKGKPETEAVRFETDDDIRNWLRNNNKLEYEVCPGYLLQLNLDQAPALDAYMYETNEVCLYLPWSENPLISALPSNLRVGDTIILKVELAE